MRRLELETATTWKGHPAQDVAAVPVGFALTGGQLAPLDITGTTEGEQELAEFLARLGGRGILLPGGPSPGGRLPGVRPEDSAHGGVEPLPAVPQRHNRWTDPPRERKRRSRRALRDRSDDLPRPAHLQGDPRRLLVGDKFDELRTKDGDIQTSGVYATGRD